MPSPTQYWSLIFVIIFRASTVLAFVTTLGLGVATAQSIRAQTYKEKVLYSFSGAPDGSYPGKGWVQLANGALYGTTLDGGDYGLGTVFTIGKRGRETVLYSFSGGNDGGQPDAGLVVDAQGDAYGTTDQTVFRLDHAGTMSVIHAFYPSEGPVGGLTRGPNGDFYGTTGLGGAHNLGTIFKVDADGTFRVLHSFAGHDGARPWAGLVRDEAGTLYGTTVTGGDLSCDPPLGCGTVFRLDTNLRMTVLHKFAGGRDGASPWAGLVRSSQGNLFGTTDFGGGTTGCGGGGCGTVFKVDGSGTETVLLRFDGKQGGGCPTGRLVLDDRGNLYGTTSAGGNLSCLHGGGCGIVFKLDSAGNEIVLHSFGAENDGTEPGAGLLLDVQGNLLGTTAAGGASGTGCGGFGCGTVFELMPR